MLPRPSHGGGALALEVTGTRDSGPWASFLSLHVSCLRTMTWLQAPSGLSPYSLRIKEERWAFCQFQWGKSYGGALIGSGWVMCLSLDQWLWSGEWDAMTGQILSHRFKPAVRGGGSTERVCWIGKLAQLSLVFVCSRQRHCAITSSLMFACWTDTNIPTRTVVKKNVELPRCPWLFIQPVRVNARACTQVCKCVRCELVPWAVRDLRLVNIYNLSKGNSCQTTGLLSRDQLLTLLYDLLQ